MCHKFFLTDSEDFARSNSYLEILSATSVHCIVSFKQMQIFNQNTVFDVEWHVYEQQ